MSRDNSAKKIEMYDEESVHPAAAGNPPITQPHPPAPYEVMPEAIPAAEAEYPPETAALLSWSALTFIRAPSVRIFQWSVTAILILAVVGVALLQFIHKDVTVDSKGEVTSDLGTRDAASPSAGLISEIRIKAGDAVEENAVIATLALDAKIEAEIQKSIADLKSLIRTLESATKREDIQFVLPHLSTGSLTAVGTLESIAAIEVAAKAFQDLRDRVHKGIQAEVNPLRSRVEILHLKIRKMQSSKRKQLMELYLESSQEELGRVNFQISTLENDARMKLEQGYSELMRSVRIGVGALENYLRQRQVISPISGIISRILVRPNSAVEAGKAVAIVMPKNGRYMAAIHLLSKDIVRVNAGQSVLFKMEAYPYQSYGLFSGKVVSIEQSRDVPSSSSGNFENVGDFIVYSTLDLPNQLSSTVKEKIRFIVGMRLTAEIVVDRKPISTIIHDRFFENQ